MHCFRIVTKIRTDFVLGFGDVVLLWRLTMRRNRTGEIGLLALFAYVFVMTCAGGAIEGTWHPIENTIEGWVGWDVNGDGDVAGEAPKPPTVE
jgi:hypothetical protein